MSLAYRISPRPESIDTRRCSIIHVEFRNNLGAACVDCVRTDTDCLGLMLSARPVIAVAAVAAGEGCGAVGQGGHVFKQG